MLSQQARESIQNLINYPEFEIVEIIDQKTPLGDHFMFSNTVYIHAVAGSDQVIPILDQIPGLKLQQPEPYEFEHCDHISIGQKAKGNIERADVTVWMIERKEKKILAQDQGTNETHQTNFTTEGAIAQ